MLLSMVSPCPQCRSRTFIRTFCALYMAIRCPFSWTCLSTWAMNMHFIEPNSLFPVWEWKQFCLELHSWKKDIILLWCLVWHSYYHVYENRFSECKFYIRCVYQHFIRCYNNIRPSCSQALFSACLVVVRIHFVLLISVMIYWLNYILSL